jgi:plastocyanin
MRVRLYAFIAPLILAVAACGGGGGTTGPNNGNPGGNPGGTPGSQSPPVSQNTVSVSDDVFTPANIQVNVGTTVTWNWAQEARDHNVTFNDGTTSGNKSAGASYSRTFATAGTFNYSCTLHGGMNGSVLVK